MIRTLSTVANHTFSTYCATATIWMSFTKRRSSASTDGVRVFSDWLDRWVWNGAVQVVSYLVLGLSWMTARWIHTW